MRIRTIVVLVLAVLVSGGGCALSPEQSDGARGNAHDRYDQETINAINQDARRQGAEVIWIHPPTRSDSDSDGDA